MRGKLKHRFFFAFLACLSAFCLLPISAQAAPPSLAPADGWFAQGQFEPARQAYAEAVIEAPNDMTPRIGLIRSLLRLDRWTDALTEAQAFSMKFPDNADAHGLLGLALIRAGWQEPYAAEAKQSLTLDPSDYWGLVASGRAADWDGRTADAQGFFRKASAAHPELPDAWLGLLQTLNDKHDAKERETVAEAYFHLHPTGQPHDRMGEELRDGAANAASYRRAFEADPPFQRLNAGAKEGGTNASPTTLAVEFVGDYAVFPVTINSRRFHLLFDTGAGRLLLSREAVKRLNLLPLAHSFIRGVGGKEDSEIFKADNMTMGDLAYQSIEIHTMRAALPSTDGILGGSLLADSIITLDYAAASATLRHGPEADAPMPKAGNLAIALPLHWYHGRLYIPVTLNTVRVWALLDTGAQESFLSLRLARAQLQNTPKSEVLSGSLPDRLGIGNTDRRTDYIASRDESEITLSLNPPAELPTPTIGISSLDRELSPNDDFEIGMLLGVSSLTYAQRVTFDYQRHLLTFEYLDPTKAAPQNDEKKR